MENKFTAEPKLISNKNKYKSQMIDPTILEKKYILKIQEKNKKQNIENQINLFKNKFYETPYDIKAWNKKKIPINLDFFLIENKGEDIIKKEFGTQIDKIKDSSNPDILTFKKRNFLKKIEHLNKGKPIGQNDYIPKKTGIDVYTQVEHDELFDFDKEVAPIINIIITKTLEQSLLEIEEETEIENMKKFKEKYFKKRLNKDNKENKKIIENEKFKLKNNNEILDKKNNNKKLIEEIQEKVLINDISTNFLKNILKDSIEDLKSKNYYKIDLNNMIYNNIFPSIFSKIEKKQENNELNFDKILNLLPNYEEILYQHNKVYYDHLEKEKRLKEEMKRKKIEEELRLKQEEEDRLNNLNKKEEMSNEGSNQEEGGNEEEDNKSKMSNNDETS